MKNYGSAEVALELVNEAVNRDDYVGVDYPRNCHGCGAPAPVCTWLWLYVDEPRICWCPPCVLLFNHRAEGE